MKNPEKIYAGVASAHKKGMKKLKRKLFRRGKKTGGEAPAPHYHRGYGR